MNTYELTLLFPDGKDAKEKTRVVKMIEDFVKKHKGSLLKTESWGTKNLAYPIKKQVTAEYEHFVLSLESTDQPELERFLSLDEYLLRYLVVRV
ncbi:MAG: 30S ribosomal protein S6 [Microgenomates group bacterium GW2011_GWF2_47_9]|nr:MAG: 30S ribosomal protein S6 [Microgenomates group bacterium GW2011_GWF2_47_9]